MMEFSGYKIILLIFLQALLQKSAVLGTDITCKPGWHMFEGICYKGFLGKKAIWGTELKSACAEENSIGVVINSRKISDFIASKVTSMGYWYWIGLSFGEFYWEWSDGSPMKYTNWRSTRYPTYRNCVTMKSGWWVNKSCRYILGYSICQYRPKALIHVGHWSVWSLWNGCSVTCDGTGTKSRTRSRTCIELSGSDTSCPSGNFSRESMVLLAPCHNSRPCDQDSCTGELDKDYNMCCLPYLKCSEDEGNCNTDADCKDSLICAMLMCPPKRSFDRTDSCCVKDCSGNLRKNYAECCKSDHKCPEYHGDCNNDDECQDGLVCGVGTCPVKPGFVTLDACCMKGCDGSNSSSRYGSCCSSKHKCPLNHGDCDYRSDCLPGLTCGTNNCPSKPGFVANDDCCQDLDECHRGDDNCHTWATCTNTQGSFTCTCKAGYIGDGVQCYELSTCRSYWHIFKGNCYKSFELDGKINGTSVKAACAKENSTAVTIPNKLVNDFIRAIMTIKNRPFWIGLSFTLGGYVWPNGSLPNYTNWQKKYPKSRSCAVTDKRTGKWKSYLCKEKAYYICEYRLQESGWTKWSSWSACSATCNGNGTKSRVRTCIKLSLNDKICSDGMGSVQVTPCISNRPCNNNCTGELDKDYSTCCSPSHKCSEDEGVCHSDADCAEGLFCVQSMCPPQKSFDSLDSCCVKDCSGNRSRNYGDCCKPEHKCPENHGGCHSDDDCQDGLHCGYMMCRKEAGFIPSDACCVKGCSGEDVTVSYASCCSSKHKCPLNYGDCDYQSDCLPGLRCGVSNCPSKPGLLANSDCCKDIDECAEGNDNCHTWATCTNTPGSFNCTCNTGYVGDGVRCYELNTSCRAYWNSFEGNCYRGFEYDGEINGSSVKEACEKENSTAVTIPSKPVNDFIQTIITTKNGPFWIGLTFTLGGYVWPNGSLPNYTNWQVNYPKSRGCVILRKNNGKWESRPCKEKGYYVCEYRPPESGWTEWSPWSDCSVTCNGNGIKSRARTCTRLSLSDKNCSFEFGNSRAETFLDRQVANCTRNRPCQNNCTGELDSDYSKCCSPSHKCSEDEGVCHSDADCMEGLFCLQSMCPPQKRFDFLDSCCVKGCSGNLSRNYGDCCNPEHKCPENHGVCDGDEDCQDGLFCGHMMCPKKTGFISTDACCMKGCSGDNSAAYVWNCCSDKHKCPVNHGDCDHHSECLPGLRCGADNCNLNAGFPRDADCCEDMNECKEGKDNCDKWAHCRNTFGSFNCTCVKGFDGDGIKCIDIDECKTGKHGCHSLATCTNVPGSFNCMCKKGYEGDGLRCYDTDECSAGSHNCDRNRTCFNTIGSFYCVCNKGFTGNGESCSDINECAAGGGNCHKFAACINVPGSFSCKCPSGYEGNGRNCTAHQKVEISLTLTELDWDDDFMDKYSPIFIQLQQDLSNAINKSMDYTLVKLVLYSVIKGSVIVDFTAIFEDKNPVETDKPISFVKKLQTAAKLGSVGGLTVDGGKVLVVDIEGVETADEPRLRTLFPWSTWSLCSVACGLGFQSRDRTCIKPESEEKGNVCNETAGLQRSSQTRRCTIPCTSELAKPANDTSGRPLQSSITAEKIAMGAVILILILLSFVVAIFFAVKHFHKYGKYTALKQPS